MDKGLPKQILNKCHVKTEVQDGKLVYIFDKRRHAQTLLHNLSVMQDEPEASLSDVVIISKENEQFHFHAPILAALSKQLEEHLLEHGLGSTTSKIVIKEEFSSEAIQCLWDYAYTSVVTLTPSNIHEVKELAEHHALDDLKNECEVLDHDFQAAVLIFKDLPEFLLNRLHDLLKEGKLSCAFIIAFASRVRVPCHSSVIAAACSEFGFELVYGDSNNKLEVKDNVFKAMGPFVLYLYTAKLMIDQATVLPLLEFALKFNLPSVCNACCCCLKYISIPDNAFHMMATARDWLVKVQDSQRLETRKEEPKNCVTVTLYDALDNLYQYARSLILRNLMKYFDEHLGMSLEELIDLMVDDKLVVDSQEDVFYAVIKWVEFDRDTRVEELPILLQSVHLERMSVDFLKTILEHDLIMGNNGCIGVINNALDDKCEEARLYYNQIPAVHW